MGNIFLNILNISITAGWLVLAVVVLRLLLRKAPKTLAVGMWALVGIRLICPISLESVLSLIPSVETVPTDIMISEAPEINSGMSAVDSVLSKPFVGSNGISVNVIQVITFAMSIAWCVGVVSMFAYSVISFLRLHNKVKVSLLYRDNIYFCDNIDSPFVLGIFRPRIYIPSGMAEEQVMYVIKHEKAHLKRKDNLWKSLGFLLLSVYWFNPLMWVAYNLLCRDIEFACDEKVIKDMNNDGRKGYSETLVSCAVRRRMIMACPLAFGEVGVKDRVKSVRGYRKPGFWTIVIAIALCIIVAITFLTNPLSTNVDKIIYEKGYTITFQEKYSFTITIPKDIIKEAAYTSDGQNFKENEVVLCKTDTTTIYLEKIIRSNESEDMLYLIFNYSYKDIGKYDSILLPYGKDGNGFGAYVGLESESIYDEKQSYEDSVSFRGWGPSEQFIFYVSTDVIKNCDEVIKINAYCNNMSYEKSDLFDMIGVRD